VLAAAVLFVHSSISLTIGVVVGGNPVHALPQAAAICRAAGEPLTIEDIVVDPPRAYELRIKIICTSLCHTDISVWLANIEVSTLTTQDRISLICYRLQINQKQYMPLRATQIVIRLRYFLSLDRWGKHFQEF
jgi:hypothetical protein